MTLYDILEVNENASEEVIRVAYRTLAKKYHPDVYTGDPKFADEKMKELNKAYEILSNAERRRQYDYELKRQRNQHETHNANAHQQQHQQQNYQQQSASYQAKNEPAPESQNIIHEYPSGTRSAWVTVVCLFLIFSQVFTPYIEDQIMGDLAPFLGFTHFALACLITMIMPVLISFGRKSNSPKSIKRLCTVNSVLVWILSLALYALEILNAPFMGWIAAVLFYFVNKHILFQLHANGVSRKKAYIGTIIAAAVIILLVRGCGYLAMPLINNDQSASQHSEENVKVEKPQMTGGLKEDLYGIWVAREYESEEQVRTMLENIDFYEEEIALVDLGSFAIQKTFIFTENDRYYMGIGHDVTERYCYEFFEGVFADLYANRTRLNKIYETKFNDMTQDEFYAFYADMYEADSIYELIDQFVAGIIQYADLDYNCTDEGSFRINGSSLELKSDVDNTSGSVEFSVNKAVLNIGLSDVQIKYTRDVTHKDMMGVRTISLNDAWTAEFVVELWKAEGASEEKMIQLMNEYGKEQGGGQLYLIKPGEFVEEIDDWCFAATRQIGDVEIIENPYGYTICYISIDLS